MPLIPLIRERSFDEAIVPLNTEALYIKGKERDELKGIVVKNTYHGKTFMFDLVISSIARSGPLVTYLNKYLSQHQ